MRRGSSETPPGSRHSAITKESATVPSVLPDKGGAKPNEFMRMYLSERVCPRPLHVRKDTTAFFNFREDEMQVLRRGWEVKRPRQKRGWGPMTVRFRGLG